MLKIESFYFVSSVETDENKEKGKAHLFKFDEQGELVSSVVLSEGIVHHPGGIDYDGKFIWIPVSQYKRNSTSKVMIVDPSTLQFQTIFEFNDHLGAVICEVSNQILHGYSWGSRTHYSWKANFQTLKVEKEVEAKENSSFYIDYQDCHYIGQKYALCSGILKYNFPCGVAQLGGIDLVDLELGLPIRQLPICL